MKRDFDVKSKLKDFIGVLDVLKGTDQPHLDVSIEELTDVVDVLHEERQIQVEEVTKVVVVGDGCVQLDQVDRLINVHITGRIALLNSFRGLPKKRVMIQVYLLNQ